MRGTARYRYQGDYISTVQSQLMWQVASRWTVQGFVGVGSAGDNFDDLYHESEWAYGVCFRYLIARRFGLRTGVDIAFSDDDSAFYFNVCTGF
ncbi:hypothetical protein [Vibrio sp. S11_S32]|uniref:hypothetical protein n=1 Tax=Vibrio sp. S11_S32 TaxID=2720225 RepID=UPI001933FD7F|nr:hypothetical protein [Vibrio sp. S11_S32]